MLLIRAAQLEALKADAVRRFIDELAADVSANSPVPAGALGSEATRGLVREGVARAARYGITSRRGVGDFVRMMLSFGRDFDASPENSWAATVLNDPKLRNPQAKMRRLVTAAVAIARGRVGTTRDT